MKTTNSEICSCLSVCLSFYLIEQVKFWQLLAGVDLLHFHRVSVINQINPHPVKLSDSVAMSKCDKGLLMSNIKEDFSVL